MNKRSKYIVTILIAALAFTSLLAMPAVAAELKQMKGQAKLQKPNFTAARQKLQSKFQAEAAKGNTDLQTKRTNFEQEQKARLDSRNSQAMAELQRLKTNAEQIRKIRAEAAQLNSKIGTAAPAERERINKRAGELMMELDKLGY